MVGTPVGAPLIGWISEHLGARWGLIAGGVACVVTAVAAGAVLARGRRVRLEVHVTPPSAQLHVAAPPATARAAGTGGGAAAEVPDGQAAGTTPGAGSRP